MELLETLSGEEVDWQDAHAQIEQEMGWSPLASLAVFDASTEDADTFPSDSPEPDDESEPAESIPAYKLAHVVGLEVMRAVQAVTAETESAQYPETVNERLQSAVGHALMPASKLSGGHAMGYDDEVLGGHIVYCKSALEAAVTARDDVRWLTEQHVLPVPKGEYLVQRLDNVRAAIETRLSELRGNIWW